MPQQLSVAPSANIPLTDFTEPGWTVELYINNVIVDYVTADASGFFSFDVPMVYGTSQVVLKFYGPYGEERIQEQYLNIPYNFLPKGELEYNITGGMVQDGRSINLFARCYKLWGESLSYTWRRYGISLIHQYRIRNTIHVSFCNTI
jgi:hypothetical protein